ncbi:hypothetical protein V6N12_010613 [Hibiscus sabdariffa]|uniref:FCP1 homology domain-containing protein n=1 Tax=Hibiscus sabdariffa TaxID=183260 RepID=A0ABR2EKY4_9ROSI
MRQNIAIGVNPRASFPRAIVLWGLKLGQKNKEEKKEKEIPGKVGRSFAIFRASSRVLVLTSSGVVRAFLPIFQALLQRYNPENKCFEFGVDNLIRLYITLGDELRITRLPIHGNPVIVDGYAINVDLLCIEKLGNKDMLINKGNISLTKLLEQFGKFKDGDTLENVDFHVRAATLYIIGSVIGLSTSSTVPSLYLALLEDVTRIESSHEMFIFERIPWVVSRLLNPRAPKTLPEFIEGDNALPTEFPLMVKWHKKMDRFNSTRMRDWKKISCLRHIIVKLPWKEDIPGISPTHVQEDVGVDEQYTDSGTLPTPDQVDDIPGTPIQEQNDVEYGGLQQNNAEDISGTLPTQEEDVRDDEQQDHASALPQEHDHAGALTQRLRELLTYRRKRRKHAMGQLPRKHRAREDKLEIKKMIIYGVKHAVNELYKLKSIPNPENGEKLTDEAYEDPNKYLQSLTPPKRKLVIWDVNGVLANISFQRKKVVTMRPGVSQFIQFCLNNFVVAIWSSKLR